MKRRRRRLAKQRRAEAKRRIRIARLRAAIRPHMLALEEWVHTPIPLASIIRTLRVVNRYSRNGRRFLGLASGVRNYMDIE